MLCCFSGTTYDVIFFPDLHNTKTLISPKRKKDIAKKEKRHSSPYKALLICVTPFCEWRANENQQRHDSWRGRYMYIAIIYHIPDS